MVYIFYFLFLIIGVFITNNHNRSKMYLFYIMTFLLFIIGLRDTKVGTDTLSYTEDFTYFAQMSSSEIWSYALTRKEPLYVLISWLPSTISTNYTYYLLIWALFPVISLYKVFKEELEDSNDILIAMLVFFLLGLFAFYVAGIRQTAALSIVFIGAKYLKQLPWNRFNMLIRNINIYKFFISIVIAYAIHNSSLLFVLAIPCLFFRVRWWYLLIIFGLFSLGKYIQIDQIVLLSKFLFDDRFSTYGTVYESSQNTSALIMQTILFVICFLVKSKLIKRDYHNNFFFNMMFLGLIFQSLSGMLAEMARISFYFIMFAMLLVPKAFKEYNCRIRSFIYVSFTLVCIYYLFFLTSNNLPEYHSVF